MIFEECCLDCKHRNEISIIHKDDTMTNECVNRYLCERVYDFVFRKMSLNYHYKLSRMKNQYDKALRIQKDEAERCKRQLSLFTENWT